MRVLIVNKFLYPNGGSETYIFELGKQLVSMGHEVQYFGMEHPDRIVGNKVDSYTSNMDFHGGSKLSKFVAPFKIIYSSEARKKIGKVLDDFKPDVIHLNNINFQITPSIIYEIRAWEKKNHRVKIVFTAHDYQWICPNHMLYIPNTGELCERCKGGKYIECAKNGCIHGSKARSLIGSFEAYYYKCRKTYALVDTIICPSQFLYDKFAKDEILRDKLVMMHNFLTMDVTDVSTYAKSDEPYVLYFGRFDVQKGMNTLLEACKRLPEIPFIFAGSGPMETEVNSVGNIKNIGFTRGDDLYKLIAGAKFSVYPSEWYENCPFSVMESQMLGTPVIGANIGGIPELICTEDIPTGRLFTAGDVDGLVDEISKLWNDNLRLKQMQENCVNTKFDSVNEYTKKLLEIYA